MLGEGSIKLFRIFGIRVGASPSWFLVLFLFLYTLSRYFTTVLVDSSNDVAYAVALAATLLFFVSLLAHELGHALAARREGIETEGIDLWLFGGVAKLSRDSESPGEEFRVAAAGPAVTAVLSLLFIVIGRVASSQTSLIDHGFFTNASISPGIALVNWLATVNVFLLAFNLIPAFPLDGGRIARSIAWRVTGDRGRATRFSAALGQGFSWVLIGIGVLLAVRGEVSSGIWLMVLGWFLGSAARGAVVSSRFTDRLEGVTAADLMDEQPVAIPSSATVAQAHDDYFLRYRAPWFAVVDEAGRYAGILHAQLIDQELAAGRPALRVAKILPPDGDEAAWVPYDTPVESLIGLESVRHLGAVMVLDGEDRLCGVVTADQLNRAIAAAAVPQR